MWPRQGVTVMGLRQAVGKLGSLTKTPSRVRYLDV